MGGGGGGVVVFAAVSSFFARSESGNGGGGGGGGSSSSFAGLVLITFPKFTATTRPPTHPHNDTPTSAHVRYTLLLSLFRMHTTTTTTIYFAPGPPHPTFPFTTTHPTPAERFPRDIRTRTNDLHPNIVAHATASLSYRHTFHNTYNT